MMSGHEEGASSSQFFREPEWFGFRHDGYPVVPLAQYLPIRQKDRPSSQTEPIETTLKEQAASRQSLLTFGLLEAVTEKHVEESVLVRKNENGKLVMSKKFLPEIIQDWIDRIKQSPEDVLESWLKRIHSTIRSAHSLMMEFTKSKFDVFDPLGDDAPAMVCLIALVAEALVNGKMVFPSHMPQQGFSWSMIWGPHYRELLDGGMVADGWCPFTVEYLAHICSVSSLEYVCKRGPIKEEREHSECSKLSCTAYAIDLPSYVPKHTALCKKSEISSGTSCNFSKASLERVVQHIYDGEIPVVTVVAGPDESSVDLEVHKASEVPYVAISHVWADGLGSTTEEGLPTCQLRRLSALVSEIRPGAAFWTDSLCIPEVKEARKKAIGMMARTYREAEVVLVLDSGLQQCSSTAPSDLSVLRVLTSGWMRRLWTLQEAVLAKELRFLFVDKLLPLKDLIPAPSDMLVFPHLTDLAGELFRLVKQSRHHMYSIGDISRSLRWRTTSRATDETLAIASLLKVQPSVLVDLGPEQRMTRLLQDIGKMPSNVLFLSGPKLQVPGFRWAPTSFMAAHGGNAKGLQLSTQTAEAVWTPHGLEATYHALIFPKTIIEARRSWKLRDTKTDQLYAIPFEEESYECDMLLLAAAIPRGSFSACASVLRSSLPPRIETDGSFTVYCEYQRRLIISDVVLNEPHTGEVKSVMSGKLRVCVG